MASDDKSVSKGGIAVAVLGMVASIGVAWVTTQAKFANELRLKDGEIARIKQDLEATERRLAERQREIDTKVAAVDDRLKKLDTQIEVAKAVGDQLAKYGGKLTGGMFGRDKDKKPAE